jgi:hypothetical protein
MTFIRGHSKKSRKSTMLVGFSNCPHGFELLKGNIHDYDEPPNGGNVNGTCGMSISMI